MAMTIIFFFYTHLKDPGYVTLETLEQFTDENMYAAESKVRPLKKIAES